MSTNNGGPAFPVAFTTTPLTGMTLRDYFAALAMQSMLREGYQLMQHIAYDAYEMADQMLKERDK